MALFFNQAMLTTDDNSFGASVTIRELLRDNASMLKDQIDEKIIKNLINLCLSKTKSSRLLGLLADLCVCNNSAILSNQDVIQALLLKKPKNREQMFFAMRTDE